MERTVTYRYSMLLGLCLAMALGAMSPLRVSGAGNDAAMLKRIASRVDGRMGVIAIEATTPVPYIASQPDPKTFVVELRDVVAVGFQNEFSADPRNPIVMFLRQVTEPVLAPVRRLLPPWKTGGLDLSPLIVLLVIQFVERVVVTSLLRSL